MALQHAKRSRPNGCAQEQERDGQLDGINQSGWLQFLKIYLEFGIKLGQVNPAGEQDGFGPSVKRWKIPLWSRLAELFYYYFTAKLLLALMLQHEYNSLMRECETIDKMRASASSLGESSDNDNHRTRNQYELGRTVARLELVGNAYYELGYAMEPVFIFILYVIYLYYLQTRLYVGLMGAVRFSVLRKFIDSRRERKHVLEPEIGRQTSRFIGSSLNHLQARRVECMSSQRTPARRYRPGLGPMRRASPRSPSELELAHEQVIARLCDLANRKQLMPPNATPAWTKQLGAIYCLLLGSFWLSVGSLGGTILFVLPYSGAFKVKMHNNRAGILFQLELICYGLLGIQWVGFLVIMFIVNAIDQIKFAVALKDIVTRLTGEICLAVAATASRHQGKVWPKDQRQQPPVRDLRSISTQLTRPSSNICHLNGQIARILILYKLLKSQLETNQKIVRWMSAIIVIVMLVAPVMCRLYAARLPAEVRLAFLAWSVFIIVISDFLLIPVCLFHARCLDLFKSMSYLLAHIDEHQVRCGRGVAATSYDEHTLWLLRSEQSLPEVSMRRFATDAYFLRLTYNTFIGIHFWCGLLLTPMLMKDTRKLGTESTGSLLTELF